MKRKIVLTVCVTVPLIVANLGLVWFARANVRRELTQVSNSVLANADNALTSSRQLADVLHQQQILVAAPGGITKTGCGQKVRQNMNKAINSAAFIREIDVLRGQQTLCSTQPGVKQVSANTQQQSGSLSQSYSYPDGYRVLIQLRTDYFQEAMDAQAIDRYRQVVMRIGTDYLYPNVAVTDKPPAFKNEWVAQTGTTGTRVYVEAANKLAWTYILDSVFTWNAIALLGGWLLFRQARRYFSAVWQFDSALAKAIQHEEIVPYFQAVYTLSGLRLSGVEILARWQIADQTFIAPDRFIARAEQLGLIADLTRSLMAATRIQVPALGLPAGSTVALNLSAEALADEALIDDVIAWARALVVQGLQPVVELTERSFVEISQEDHIHCVFARLREHCVQLALDDFGAEYSSLGYLHRFHFDCIKIDGLFMDGLHDQQNADRVLDCVLQLVAVLDVKVVVEKVETAAQLAWLSTRNVDAVQGYYFGRAQSAQAWQQPWLWPSETVEIAAVPMALAA